MRSDVFYDLVSGRRTGLSSAAARAALAALEVPYRWTVNRRNREFDRGLREIVRAAAPVISVGNLTLGGSGKTPAVAYFVQRLAAAGRRPAILSRGYGAERGAANDEAQELELLAPGVPHLQHPDRVASAATAVGQLWADALVLDDGFQHRRLHRDLDVVLIDATAPDGFGRVFPRGALREPLAGLARADLLVLSRADQVSADRRVEIRAMARQHNPTAPWVEARHAPKSLRDRHGGEQALASLGDQRVAAFCAIGNPHAFEQTLEDCGINVAGFRSFPDHYRYGKSDLVDLTSWASRLAASAMICTLKDLVKLKKFSPALPLRALTVAWDVTSGEAELAAALDRVCGPAPARTDQSAA